MCDEMLGRLSRYLRILGYDTEYVQGRTDEAILEELRRDLRRLVTRDRALGARAEAAIVLRSTDLPGQLREMASAVAGFPRRPRFDRCTACNGPLQLRAREGLRDPSQAPAHPPGPYWECSTCAHVYWEGTHTARLRSDLATWLGAAE
jgi:uncharacterized protein